MAMIRPTFGNSARCGALVFCFVCIMYCSPTAPIAADESIPSPSTDVKQESKAVHFVLAGDSTVTDNAGWGVGFRQLLSDRGRCTNLAKGGRSSRSYRAEGWWKQCLEARPDFLLIQFGHNDQPGKGPERESAADGDFRVHLREYIREARAAGIHPVLVTSLTRRRWNSDGTIQPTLAEYAEATSIVAKELSVPLVDLHTLSIRQCEAMGATAFRAFEPMTADGADHTHLNPAGSRAVGQLVVAELLRICPELVDCFLTDAVEQAVEPAVYPREISGTNAGLRETDETIELSAHGRPLLSYRKQSPPVPAGIPAVFHRSGCLHPVLTPAGKTVTAMFPADHPHQHGIFSAWVRTSWNGRE
ncbi:MAG: PmoA family protein, partial [Planctomycetaceae bacterium]|nr:PmoA family protein [Planctomycetaceae bacterium]